MPSLAELIPLATFLADHQILAALEAGHLIEMGTWDRDQIRHASYTLRLGPRVELFRASQERPEDRKEFAVVALTAASLPIELRPGDTALLYSMEHLRMPDSVLGFTVARGLLFAEALTPENTYVDPGFAGPLYTTVTNVSNRIVSLNYGMSVCRLFFFSLAERVSQGYRSGPSLGIDQQLRSVRAAPLGTTEQCSQASDFDLLGSVREMPFCGIHLAELLERHSTRRRRDFVRLGTAAVVWPLLLIFVNTNLSIQANLGTFLANVLASVVAGLLLLFGPRVAGHLGFK